MSIETTFSELIGIDVAPHYAPIRRLDDGALAGAELQLRGPAESALGSPSALRRAAQLMQQRAEFDEHKVALAQTDAVQTVAQQIPVFVMVDSAALDSSVHTVVTVDATEALTQPHEALAAVAAARAAGRTIALGGVGTDAHAATLLALVEPDIIVMSAVLVSGAREFDIGAIAHALSAYVERSNAVIIAEGVDDASARLAAITIGATYGIGELYPAVDVASETIVPLTITPPWTTPVPDADTPYAIASARADSRRGTKRLLIQMSKALEAQAAAAGSSMLALGTFQRAQHFTPTTAARWRHLADTIGFTGVYGVGLSQMLDGNVQHAPLDPADDLVDEWTVVTLGPHHAALLTARDRHDNGPDLERTFDFVQTYDRTTVTQAAHSIMRRYESS